jgi:NAD(P)-dependent dehydrogenase (short-subunit alcohol dehydrogenase family)
MIHISRSVSQSEGAYIPLVTDLIPFHQTNTLGSVYLALLLIPTLRKTRNARGKPSRLLFISSEVHAFSNFTKKSLPNAYRTLTDEFPKSASGQPYHTSKLLMVLLVKQLAEKVDSSELIIGLATPGYAESELLNDFRNPVTSMLEAVFCRSMEQGGRLCTLAAIASTDEEFHGGYNSHAKWRQ